MLAPWAQAEALNRELLQIMQALADLSKRVGRSEGITTPQAVTEPQLTTVAGGSSFSEQHLPPTKWHAAFAINRTLPSADGVSSRIGRSCSSRGGMG